MTSKNAFSIPGLVDLGSKELSAVNGGVSGSITLTGPNGGSATLSINGSDGSGTITGSVTGPQGQTRSATVAYTIT